MILTIVLSIILMAITFVFYRQRKKNMQIFKVMGIPGPEPNFLFGNLLAFLRKPLYLKQQEWRAEFGKTYGYFEGPTPVLVTSDVNILQEVFIKKFNKFHARKLWPVQSDPDHDEDVHLFFARGRRWKRLRNIVTPAFSAAKMKHMTPTVNDCINHLLDVIKDKSIAMNDRSVELLELFRRMTLDTILRCEVGLEQNSVKNPDDPFLRHCKGIIDDTAKNPWLYTLGFMFPSLHCVWMAIYKFLHYIAFNPVYWIEARMREVVELRRGMKGDRSDLMQQMINAQLKVDHFKDLDLAEDKIDSNAKLPKTMTNEEIVSHALLFLLAGYETTSTTLSYVFYELSQNPHVQHQLRQEVMTILPRGYSSIEYDDLKKLKYLDYVIWETLRKYPLASTVTARQCMAPCRIENIDIPVGMLVHANLWDVQYDPKHWGDNPHEFDPLRFIPQLRRERHPMAWMPFGGGPRSCAGIRFAFLQLKMVVAKVLRDFDFHPTHRGLSVPLQLKQGATIMPADGVHLSAMRRGSAMSDNGNSRRGSANIENGNSRRGSILTTLGLDDYNSSRSTSSQEEDLDSFLFNSDDMRNANSMRRASIPKISVPKITTSRCHSESFDESLESSDDSEAIRRDSLLTGFELLRRASLTKALEILLNASNVDVGAVEGESSRRSSIDSIISTGSRTDDIPIVHAPMDDQMSKYRRMTRRSSALPVLESVGECMEVESFMQTNIGFTDKEIRQRSRCSSRRGSG